MDDKTIRVSRDDWTPVLAVLSCAMFWLLPFSPLMAMAAVTRSRGTVGWPRHAAVCGAMLCTTYTLALGGWIALLAFTIG